MATLVTGGTGAIGSWTCCSLVKLGESVVALDAAPRLDLLYGLHGLERHVEVIQGDVLDVALLGRVVRQHRITRIVHLAAIVSARVRRENPSLEVRVGVEGWLNVLELARMFDIQRVIYGSSRAVYGKLRPENGFPSYVPVGEEQAYCVDPEGELPVYAATKVLGEQLGLHYHRTYGVEYAAVRFGSTFGPGKTMSHGGKPQRLGLDGLIVAAARGEPVRLDWCEGQVVDSTYYADIGEAVARLCLKPGSLTHRAYNVSSGKGYSRLDFVKAVQSVLPHAEIEVNLNPPPPVPDTFVLENTRLQQEIQFASSFSPRAAVADYVEAIAKLGLR